jgi:FHA domain
VQGETGRQAALAAMPTVCPPGTPARTLRIGRAPDNDIVISDRSVSGHHAELHQAADASRIVDLGSTNGTFVNEQRVTDAALSRATEAAAARAAADNAASGALTGTDSSTAMERSLYGDDLAPRETSRSMGVTSIMRLLSSGHGGATGAAPSRGSCSLRRS